MSKENELELKFTQIVSGTVDYNEILDMFVNKNFVIKSHANLINEDHYFDTENMDYYKTKKSFRIRKKIQGGNISYVCNYKENKNGNDFGSLRDEYSYKLSGYNILEAFNKAKKEIHSVRKLNTDPVLMLVNSRSSFMLLKNDILIEISFDDVMYYNYDKTVFVPDKGLEVEVKKDGKRLNDVINDTFTIINNSSFYTEESANSKYEKGIDLINKETKVKKRIMQK